LSGQDFIEERFMRSIVVSEHEHPLRFAKLFFGSGSRGVLIGGNSRN
jgi:hypothetical protein